uniref:CBF1-interacting co-repressor CIR N-terminal domain-containing protein n=1 Tax=Panagrolaimus davidi TaxID=227884 RepID=A0A914Q2C7_9BILA
MSKKDFHPSAYLNLKKVWEAKEKKKLDEQKQEELRVQYEKEQEIMGNKALLGDEKAKLGLSFMYDAPTGMTKREESKEEPKFEWQRKYNAPREEWAKGNDAIQDQPFGIQVRNVRCVKCHTWGHLNTDRECPLYDMSGNAENPGYANNPSDLLKEFRAEKSSVLNEKNDETSDSENEYEEVKHERVNQVQLLSYMKEDHGFNLKKNILHNIRSDDVLKTLGAPKDDLDDVQSFFKNINPSPDKQAEKKAKEESPYYGKSSRYEKSSRDAKRRRYGDDERSTRYDKSSRHGDDGSSSRYKRSIKEEPRSSRHDERDRYDKNDRHDRKRRRSRSRS